MQTNIALVSLKNIRHNAACISRASGNSPLFAIVKDDAYGHGMSEVAHALSHTVSAFGVATVAEGAALRTSGITGDILVLTPPLCEEEAVRGCAYDLIFTISSQAVYSAVIKAAERHALSPRAHLAVNTGMNRMGVRPDRVKSLLKRLKHSPVRIEGIYSHLYAPHDGAAREAQRELFVRASEDARELYPTIVRHLSATGGILAGEQYRFDAVRSGIALYGYLPSGFEGRLPVKPAMRLYSHVVQSGKFTGGGVGYAPATRNYDRLTTVRLGYGDGLFREGLQESIGALCMDAHIREGSAKTGQRVQVVKDVCAYARRHNTIPYEVLVKMGERTVKIYER